MTPAILNWLRVSWDTIRTSLWALPLLMFLLGVGLAVLMLGIGATWPNPGGQWRQWISSGSGEDARNLLSTLLTAIISLAGIVLSITVVSLSLAANSYGPRLIRTFRSNLSTQVVMGILTMTIVYLLLVLRAVRGEADATQVPEAAVALGSILALVSVLGLLAFIQGVATLIVADEVVKRVRSEFDSTIKELPMLEKPAQQALRLPEDFEATAGRIRLPREGYVQSVEYSELVDWAEKHHVILRLDFRPGDFVVGGDHKVLVHPAPDDPERVRRQIGRYIVSGERRTPTQDLEFAIRHLVEVAVRALSPGINDPFTAMAVIDRLRGGLARLCRRQLPAKLLTGPSGRLRVSRDATSYHGAVDAAFHQVRQAGASKPAILVHMLKAIGAIAEHAQTNEQREALRRHAKLLRAAGERNLDEPSDLQDVEREFRKASDSLGSGRTES